MVSLTQKSIRTHLGKVKKLVLIIPLGGGAKAQYAVHSKSEADAICQEFFALNPELLELVAF
ncbi:MAG TPA: hypothetical protein ACFE0H_11140 [Elainellaceae cyanobacterium]